MTDSAGGANRLGQGIEAMQGAPRDRPDAERKSPWRFAWWLVFIAGTLYFFLPLLGTFAFSLRAQPFGSAYTGILDVKVTLTFYAPEHDRGADAPDRVIPLSDGDSATTGQGDGEILEVRPSRSRLSPVAIP